MKITDHDFVIKYCPDCRNEFFDCECNSLGRPFGQPALVASLPEPISVVSAHTGDGQAQGEVQ